MLVSSLLNSAAKKIGVIARGEELTADESADALLALQVMLRSWSAEKINVFASVHETHTLIGSTGSYTWGVGGEINTLRPNKVLGASITDSSNVTYSVNIISEGEYRNISSKTTESRSYSLFPTYSFPYITIYLYPVPNAAETLNLESLKPFAETGSFAATSDTIQIPVYYEEAVLYGLAIRLAPEFGASIPIEVAKIASDSYDRLTTLNASNFIEPVKIDIPVGSGSRYSINSDSCR
jgi:hypothetical protein